MKSKFIAKKLNLISEELGPSPNDFAIQSHCEIACEGEPGGEAFIVHLISPTALARMLKLGAEPVIWGHDVFIMESVDEDKVLATIQQILYKVNADSWQELIKLTSSMFKWV